MQYSGAGVRRRVLEGGHPTEKEGISLKNGAQPYSAQKQPPYLLVVRADITKGVHSMMRLSKHQMGLITWWQLAAASLSPRDYGVPPEKGADGMAYFTTMVGTPDDENTSMRIHMQECTSYLALGGVLVPGGIDEPTDETALPYADIGNMTRKRMEKRISEDTPYIHGGKDARGVDDVIQSLRQRGTVVFTEFDHVDTEDILNRVLVWEPSESRLWPDLAAFGVVGAHRKLKRKPKIVRGCFDPASYAHLDDHCLYAVMFRSLTGQTPSRNGIDWIRWKMISEWRSTAGTTRKQVAMLEGMTPDQYERCYLRHRGWGGANEAQAYAKAVGANLRIVLASGAVMAEWRYNTDDKGMDVWVYDNHHYWLLSGGSQKNRWAKSGTGSYCLVSPTRGGGKRGTRPKPARSRSMLRLLKHARSKALSRPPLPMYVGPDGPPERDVPPCPEDVDPRPPLERRKKQRSPLPRRRRQDREIAPLQENVIQLGALPPFEIAMAAAKPKPMPLTKRLARPTPTTPAKAQAPVRPPRQVMWREPIQIVIGGTFQGPMTWACDAALERNYQDKLEYREGLTVVIKGDLYCLLCRRWLHGNHLLAVNHVRKLQNYVDLDPMERLERRRDLREAARLATGEEVHQLDLNQARGGMQSGGASSSQDPILTQGLAPPPQIRLRWMELIVAAVVAMPVVRAKMRVRMRNRSLKLRTLRFIKSVCKPPGLT